MVQLRQKVASESETIAARVAREKKNAPAPIKCGICQCVDAFTTMHDPRLLLICSTCGLSDEITDDMVDTLRSYPFQCADCRTCEACRTSDNEELLFFCDSCLRAYHTYCLFPPLDKAPTEEWICSICKQQQETSALKSRKRANGTADASRRVKRKKDHTDPDKSTETTVLVTIPTPPPPILASPPPIIIQTVSKPIPTPSISAMSLKPPLVPPPNQPNSLPKRSNNGPSLQQKSAKIPTIKLTLKSTPPTSVSKPPTKVATDDESESIPEFFYGGKLTGDQADTKKGTPHKKDRRRFEFARETSNASLPPPAEVAAQGAKANDGNETAGILKIKHIQFGDYEIDTWFAAPYPEEFHQQQKLFLCEYCLKYMKSSYMLGRHKLKCPLTHPPGDEIYKDRIISIFEVDGRKNKIYCQNLCLLVKMFLDHKTLYYDVEPFLFYVMTEKDDSGHHFVGYFSKEKRSAANYNLSCIMTLPIHQRKGYGNFLIDFSYLLSKKEGKSGSPEKPLSDLGLLSYRNYWRTVLMQELAGNPTILSIQELSQKTCITIDDIVSTLTNMDMLVKNAFGDYVIRFNADLVHKQLDHLARKNYATVKPDLLRWSPFLFKAAQPLPLAEEEVEESLHAEDDHGYEGCSNKQEVGDGDERESNSRNGHRSATATPSPTSSARRRR
ncbi:hypothetical protein SeLEV6574_g00272 [Synchytrium endobioticum]|uniref:Histone acetyltransferase n=1 Tax=Synchytrium endobioticum TaxID=286115 RepID=A0A507DJP5_9FUNG|nr:hypothetical protein SeLEV6574_g00272 [Synchytrium endobioticum]